MRVVLGGCPRFVHNSLDTAEPRAAALCSKHSMVHMILGEGDRLPAVAFVAVHGVLKYDLSLISRVELVSM